MFNIKKQIKYNIGKFFWTKNEKIIKLIQRADIISFDIFDTLVKRNISCPLEVHTIVNNEFFSRTGIEIEEYQKLRVYAEKRARVLSKHEEISLDEIFINLDWGNSLQKQELKDIEIATEISVCCANNRLKELYKIALELQKRIIITSDMYLPEEAIETILKKCGYLGYERLFLSSSYMKSKSRGSLYDEINRIYRGKKILHIGDDYKADYIMSQKVGIEASLIDGRKNNLKYWKLKNKERGLYYYLNNYIPEMVDEFERIGYEVLAPLLLGFSQWLNEQLENERIEKIFFLSREGELLKKAYEILYPMKQREKKYLFVSRKALIVPLIANTKNYRELIDVVKCFLHSSQLDTIRIISGINEKEFEDEIGAIGYDKQTSIYDITETKQEEFFKIIKRLGQKYFEEQKKNVENYLSENEFYGKVAIVDIGWSGTMQRALKNLSGDKASIYGFYVGLRNMESDCFYCDLNRKGYLFSPGRNHNYDLMARFTNDIFEMLFLNGFGSVQRYEKKDTIIPVLMENELGEKEIQIIKKIQNTALKFLIDLKESEEIKSLYKNKDLHQMIKTQKIQCRRKNKLENVNISVDEIMNAYRTFAVYPALSTMRLFEDFNFLDGIKRKMLPEYNLIYYLFHMRQLKKDINTHCSKVWFLKWLLKINLPYFTIFKLLDNVGVKSTLRKKYYS